MHPILFGPIHMYGVCMAAGFLLFLATWSYLSRHENRSPNYLSNLLTILILSALVGARGAYVAEHWTEQYKANPIDVFKIWEGGLMFYGGLLVGWVALSIFALVNHERWLNFFDLIITGIPIGHALGRIGCFLEGCCFGDRTDGPLGVTYPFGSHCWAQQRSDGLIPDSLYYGPSLSVYPSQLFESALCLVIFIILVWNYGRRKKEGEQLILYGFLYGAARFTLETFRADPRMAVGPFSISQSISLGIIAFATCLAVFIHYRGRTVSYPASANTGKTA